MRPIVAVGVIGGRKNGWVCGGVGVCGALGRRVLKQSGEVRGTY